MRLRGSVRRGYALVDVMVAAAVLGIAMAALLDGLAESSRQSALAVFDQEAAAFALARIEALRAQPASAPAWGIGTTSVAVPGRPEWTCSVVVSAVSDTSIGGVAAAPSYKRAVVTVGYREKTFSLETLRW